MIFGWQMGVKKIMVLEIRYETWIFKIEAFYLQEKGTKKIFDAVSLKSKLQVDLPKLWVRFKKTFRILKKQSSKALSGFTLTFFCEMPLFRALRHSCNNLENNQTVLTI